MGAAVAAPYIYYIKLCRRLSFLWQIRGINDIISSVFEIRGSKYEYYFNEKYG